MFREHLDCEIIYVTNGVYAPDGGIDFVLINTQNGLEYAFQVKRRLTDAPERVHEVREFIGAVALSKYEHAYYVTTADRFTSAVEREFETGVSELRKHNIQATLVDADALRTILRSKTAVKSTKQLFRGYFRGDSIWNKDKTREEMLSTAFQE